MKLTGNTILITGGTRGIGLEFAKQLLELKNQIIVVGRSLEKLQELNQKHPQIHTIQCDITKESDVKKLTEKISTDFSSLNILINNAGLAKTLDLKKQQDSLLFEEFKTNLEAPIYLTNLFLPQLLKKDSAAVINITSLLAFYPFPPTPIYSASKAGLRSYTQSLRAQLQNSPVKVFEIAPPSVDTHLLASGFPKKISKYIKPLTTKQLIDYSLNEIKKDRLEIYPGKTKQFRLLMRIMPNYISKQMAKFSKQ